MVDEIRKIGLLGRLGGKITGQNYTTDKITELSKTAAELSLAEQNSVIDSALRKLETHARENPTFEKQAGVFNDPETQKLAAALMRMGGLCDDEQAKRIRTLSENHSGMKAVLEEQLFAVDAEQKLLARGIDNRPLRSPSHSR